MALPRPVPIKYGPLTPARLLCFDLENRPLAYWYDGQATSQITAFGWKWHDEPDVRTMLLLADGYFESDDGVRRPAKAAYQHFCEELASAGIVYGHNIRKHDLPMLNAWLLRLQLPVLTPLLTTDTLRDIPRRGGMSASLESFAELYELGGEKFHMPSPAWEKANQLMPEGVDLARQRVASDVVLQERLRDKLEGLGILKPPRMWNP